MNPRRETCRWDRNAEADIWVSECGKTAFGLPYMVYISLYMVVSPPNASYCPHCGGRIVREEGK